MENRHSEGGWRKDKMGVIAPVGSSASWKEFFNIGKEPSSKVANMLTRADLPPKSWPYLFLATSIATYMDKDGQSVIDPEHLIFCANVAGASVGKEGTGRKQALMAMTNIIAPAVLAGNDGDRRRGQAARLNRHDKSADDESE